MVGLRAVLLSFVPLLAMPIAALSLQNPVSVFPPKPPASSQRPQVGLSAPAIARQVSVRILTNPGIGSGVIIQRLGQTYTVVTCAHVVADTKDNRYTVLTADGQTHTARWLRSPKFPDADLALVQFTSDRAYQVVEVADSKTLRIGNPVYAAGFPNWHFNNSNAIEETRKWGTKAFHLTSGKLAMLPEKSLQEGYQLGYTNEIKSGMSGGPVLDHYGRLIGINGRLKYPPRGIIAFIFADGTVPSESDFQQMEALSWAIPTTRLRYALK